MSRWYLCHVAALAHLLKPCHHAVFAAQIVQAQNPSHVGQTSKQVQWRGGRTSENHRADKSAL